VGSNGIRENDGIEQLYFIVKYILEGKDIPYYDLGKIYDNCNLYHGYKIGGIFDYILRTNKAREIFEFFEKIGILSLLLPDVHELSFIPQIKAKSVNAFDNTLRVVEVIPIDNIILRWAGLLHDTGKVKSYFELGNFYNHQNYSYDIAKKIINDLNIGGEDLILTIIKYHMYPLDYQRNPNWTDETIKRFIDNVDLDAAILITEFAYYDKKAENGKEEYLKPILELKERIINAH